MSKRKFDNDFVEGRSKKAKEVVNAKKNSLDSDEEDESEDAYNLLDADLIPEEEDNVPDDDYSDVRKTAFNMKEEMEEGHFDRDGHFIWKKDNELRDNWLDNIDWHQVKKKGPKDAEELKGLGDDSSDEEDDNNFNEIECYKKIIQFMMPKESIAKTLQRLGGSNKKLSSVERLKLKKAGKLSVNSEQVTKLTELANMVLNQTGNMDVYQETYEKIQQKINSQSKPSQTPKNSVELDMYSDDFDEKEKQRLDEPGTSMTQQETSVSSSDQPLLWEFKEDPTKDIVDGPHTTEKMLSWVNEGKFKNGCLVRKIGQDQFYSISRIDFELYLS